MKKLVGYISLPCILTLVVSCGGRSKNNSSTDNGSESSLTTVDQPDYEIAPIAFLKSIDYSQVRDEEPFWSYTLYDQKGNVFYTDDPEITHMPWDQLLAKYEDGFLLDKLTKVATIEDKDELQKCEEKLQAILHNPDYRIIDPGSGPDVNWEITRWEGVYYNENHELKSVFLRYSHYNDQKANDPRADEIIEFLSSNTPEK